MFPTWRLLKLATFRVPLATFSGQIRLATNVAMFSCVIVILWTNMNMTVKVIASKQWLLLWAAPCPQVVKSCHSLESCAAHCGAFFEHLQSVVKQWGEPHHLGHVSSGLSRLASLFTSLQLSLYWLCYHESKGEVNAVKQDNIKNIFNYSQHCFALWMYRHTRICQEISE